MVLTQLPDREISYHGPGKYRNVVRGEQTAGLLDRAIGDLRSRVEGRWFDGSADVEDRPFCAEGGGGPKSPPVRGGGAAVLLAKRRETFLPEEAGRGRQDRRMAGIRSSCPNLPPPFDWRSPSKQP